MTSDYGTITPSAASSTATARFERTIAAPIEDVWRALTEPAALKEWLAPTEIDLRLGGTVGIDFGEHGNVSGTILEVDPPSVLEYGWSFTGEGDSVVRFELSVVDGGTRLVLDHRLLPADQASGYGAGWHAHLDQLESAITHTTAVDFDERFAETLPHYSDT